MSNKNNHTSNITGTFQKESSPHHLSRPPTPSLDVIDSGSDNHGHDTTTTDGGRSDLPLNMLSTVDVDQVVTTKTYTVSPSILLPVSAFASRQEDSGGSSGPESSPNVSTASNVSPKLPESEQNLIQCSVSGLFPNSQNILVAGGNFIYNNFNSEMKVPLLLRPNPSLIFTGRKDILDKLRKIFVHADSRLMSRHACLLWGMGGIGKTQICLKFIEEMSDSFSHVFWIDASSHDSISMSLKGISSIPAAQASGVNSSVESVLQWISHIQEEWLIVFDNADNPSPEVVAKFIPSGNRGNILVTSRNKSMGRIVSFENRIEVNEMEEADAITLLLKASCLDALPEHFEAAKRIVAKLGCIPLAVNHAGAYIEAGNCDISGYLRQFSLHHQALMSDAIFTGASGYEKTVYGTWNLSFDEIKRRASGQSTTAQACQAAILILQICAFYHHSNIPADIFRSAAEESRKGVVSGVEKLPQAITSLDHTLLVLDNNGHWDDFIFGKGISVLLSFSLIKRGNEKSSEMLFVHPLVHSWSREQMSKSEQQRICQMGSIILSCAIPLGIGHQHHALRHLIFPHIKANEIYANEIGVIGQYYDDKSTKFALVMQENGDLKSAEQLLGETVDMRKKLLGVQHPDTLVSMGNLAYTYCNQNRWNEAEQLELQVMNMRKQLLGAEHPDTLTSMGNLACIHCNQGKWNKAEQLGIQVTNMSKQLLGPEHSFTLTSMGNLARTYCNQGRWNEAEHLEAQAMNIRKKQFSIEHPDTLISMGNLASTYCDQGRWNEAEQLQVQVLNMWKKLFDAEHPNTLITMGNLASTYCHQGRWNEAEQLEVQVMHIRKKLLGIKHLDTLSSMENLAGTYCNQGRWNEAEQLEVQVMNMRKQLLNVEHPLTLISMGNIAHIFCNQGRWNEAEQLQVHVMNINRKLLGAEHPSTLTSMGNLARIYSNQGRWNEAEQLEVQVMDIRRQLFGAEHPDTLTSMGNLASTYCHQGRWNESEQLEVQAMCIRKKLFGVEHPDTLTSMGNLASTYCNQERWKEAEQLQVQVMDLRKKLLGIEHPDTLLSMGNLASAYCAQGRFNEAEQLGVQVVGMQKKLFGVEHPSTLTSMGNLASNYCHQGRWNEAEQLEIQVMNIRMKLLGKNHPDTLTTMGNLASTYSNQGRWNEAEELQVQVMDMRKKLLCEGHPLTLMIMDNLSNTYGKQRRWIEAEQLKLEVMSIRKRMELIQKGSGGKIVKVKKKVL